MRNVKALLLVMLLLLGSCSMIDDDLSGCGGKESRLDYELRLVTNMEIEIQTALQTEHGVAQALRRHLSSVFTDYAHDLDLSFYDVEADSARLHHEQHTMNANQQSYTLNIPMRRYMHTALANVQDNGVATVMADEWCRRVQLWQPVRDTVDSHRTGLFTARQPMELTESDGRAFSVRLYMANCAVALVVDPRGQDAGGMKVLTTGFATAFGVADSAFVFPTLSPVVRTAQVVADADATPLRCFCSVNFPSRESRPTRSVVQTQEPFASQPGQKSLWEIRAYVPRPGGKVTETVLSIREPLRAGELKIVKGWMGENGEILTAAPEVGVSVTLDWKPGNTYQPEI